MYHVHCPLSWCKWDYWSDDQADATDALTKHWGESHHAPMVRYP